MACTLADTRDTLKNEKAKAQKTRLLTLSPEENAKTFGVGIGDVKAKPLGKTLPENQRPAKAKETLHRLCYLMTYSLVDTMAEIVQEAKAKTDLSVLNHLKAEILIDTLGDTLAEREAKTFATHGEM